MFLIRPQQKVCIFHWFCNECAMISSCCCISFFKHSKGQIKTPITRSLYTPMRAYKSMCYCSRVQEESGTKYTSFGSKHNSVDDSMIPLESSAKSALYDHRGDPTLYTTKLKHNVWQSKSLDHSPHHFFLETTLHYLSHGVTKMLCPLFSLSLASKSLIQSRKPPLHQKPSGTTQP